MKKINQDTLSKINIFGGMGLAGLVLLFISLRYKECLWDFYSYYSASKALQSGIDPYTTNVFNEMYKNIGFSVGPHAYPPLTLFLLRPLAFMDPVTAGAIWNILKFFAVVLTFSIIQRKFFRWSEISYALPFFVFALNAAFFWDLASGNISLLEQTLIWMALACLMDDRPILFSIIIVFAAQIKLPPVLFLFLLLFYDKHPKWLIWVGACLGFAAVYSLNNLIYPQYTKEFLIAAHRLAYNADEFSSSTLIFIRALMRVAAHYKPNLPGNLDMVIYSLFCAVVGSTSLWTLIRIKRNPAVDRASLIFFFCVTYGVMMPRLMPYQYALLTFPTLYLIYKCPNFLTWPFLLTLTLFPNPHTPLPGPIQKSFVVCMDYFNILILYVVWAGYVRYFLKSKTNSR